MSDPTLPEAILALSDLTLRTHAFIAVRALEAAQWEIRTVTDSYEMPATDRMKRVEDALNHFRDILENT